MWPVIYILLTVNLGVALLALWEIRRQRDRLLEPWRRLQDNQERAEQLLREEMSRNRQEWRQDLERLNESILKRLAENIAAQTQQMTGFSRQLTDLTRLNEQKLEHVRSTVDGHLKSLREDNHRQLEAMRQTVDEKLHATLEKRLGESFQMVSERLEKVHQGLGEMQHLAAGVGDLKKVLTNVKTRGTWGEIQLGNLLEQILTPDQYERNVVTKKRGRDPVDFAIRLPGRDGQVVYIPIDAKFPKEDYERLQEAQDRGDGAAAEEWGKGLEARVRLEARKIYEKYIDPPRTTDFGILYLSTEGLYAEVLRRPGLCDRLQREFRVTLAGPTTIAAVLNSLQMGFRTLAVEKRASEVWQLLGAVKTEFHLFGGILEKTQKQLQAASNTIDRAASKTRRIEQRLRRVQEMPEQSGLLGLAEEEIDVKE